MPYADTGFFLTIIKEEDWLKSKSREVFEEFKGEIWTSITTIIELLLLSRREGIDPEHTITSVLEIAELRGTEDDTALLAANYVKRGLNVFDAFHAAFCGASRMITSDAVFEKVGVEQVNLE